MSENKTILIIGLGNPGDKYSKTRHNVGFMAVDYIADDMGADKWKSAFNALVTSCVTNSNKKIIFAKPQTYMNKSGESVLALMKFYKLPIDNLIVIHDELDINTGEVKTKKGGGSAGHNGIKSIDNLVGNDFHRVRIGISHPRELGLECDVADWVLGKFNANDMKKINPAIVNVSSIVSDLISE